MLFLVTYSLRFQKLFCIIFIHDRMSTLLFINSGTPFTEKVYNHIPAIFILKQYNTITTFQSFFTSPNSSIFFNPHFLTFKNNYIIMFYDLMLITRPTIYSDFKIFHFIRNYTLVTFIPTNSHITELLIEKVLQITKNHILSFNFKKYISTETEQSISYYFSGQYCQLEQASRKN